MKKNERDQVLSQFVDIHNNLLSEMGVLRAELTAAEQRAGILSAENKALRAEIHNLRTMWNIRDDTARYRQALEEIRAYCRESFQTFAPIYGCASNGVVSFPLTLRGRQSGMISSFSSCAISLKMPARISSI